MARAARHKSTEAAFYHLTNRVAGKSNWFPFKNHQAGRKLLDMMLFYVNAYRCRLAAFQIMGNHFHFVVHFEKLRPLSRDELMDSAHKLYGRQAEKKTADWTVAQWEAFNQRLFDVSKLMQNVDGQYALWFNRVSLNGEAIFGVIASRTRNSWEAKPSRTPSSTWNSMPCGPDWSKGPSSGNSARPAGDSPARIKT